VRSLFSEKEEAINAEAKRQLGEKDAQLAHARAALAAAQAEEARARTAADEGAAREAALQQAAAARRAEADRAVADGAAAVADLSDARAQIARLESEMRVVLRAMEQQKSAAQRNMAQLGRIWEDWQRGGGPAGGGGPAQSP